jgi:uncharacterized protein YndB with AHSA1/START domain
MERSVADKGVVAESSVAIDAPRAKVWKALVDPASIKKYMFGTTVTSDWREGSPITWKGEWRGKKYEDKGKILKLVPERTLQYSHYSPMSGQPDRPESYHTVRIELEGDRPTTVTLSQDNNASEKARAESEKNWRMMLDSLKKLLEG